MIVARQSRSDAAEANVEIRRRIGIDLIMGQRMAGGL